MTNDCPLDLEAIKRERLPVPTRTRATSGTLRRVRGLRQTADALTDPAVLAQYAESEIAGLDGKRPVYFQTKPLVDKPHLIVGYHDETGHPIIIPEDALAAHLAVVAPTQRGKSTWVGLIMYQLIKHGNFAVALSLKGTDPVIVGPMKAAANSSTRADENGTALPVPFELCSITPGEPTKGFSLLPQNPDWPAGIAVGDLLVGLGHGDSQKDAKQKFYDGAVFKVLLTLSDLGEDFQDLQKKLDALKLDKDTRRAAAAIFNEVAQLANIEAANLPDNHPSKIHLATLIKNRGVLYCSASYPDAGQLAIVWAGLVIKAIVSAKRQTFPGRDTPIYIFVDEAQLFPRPFLSALLELCASLGIRILLAFHHLDQFPEHWQTLMMVQTRCILGAVPGSLTDRYLQSLFGTKKEFVPSLSINSGNARALGSSWSALGITESVTDTNSSGDGFSLTEHEVPVWGPNDTLKLNATRGSFILQVSPAIGYAQFGPRAILCNTGGLCFTSDEINKLTHEALHNTPGTFIPGAAITRRDIQEKRRHYLSILDKAAECIRH